MPKMIEKTKTKLGAYEPHISGADYNLMMSCLCGLSIMSELAVVMVFRNHPGDSVIPDRLQ